MKKIGMIIISLGIILFMSACQSNKLVINVLSNDLHKGIVVIEDKINYNIGDMIRLEAIPYPEYEFIGWYEDDIWLSDELIYHYQAHKSTFIQAVFDEPIHVMTIEKIVFKASYENDNNDLFEAKTARLKMMIHEINTIDLAPEIFIVDLSLEPNDWVISKNHETTIVYTFQPEMPLVYEIRERVFLFNTEQHWGFHLQYTSGQHYASEYISYTAVPYRLDVSLEMTTVSLDVFQASYARLTMDITYSFKEKVHTNL